MCSVWATVRAALEALERGGAWCPVYVTFVEGGLEVDVCADLNEGMECAGYILGGPDKVRVISVGDRMYAGVCCLDGLHRAFSHQGGQSTA